MDTGAEHPDTYDFIRNCVKRFSIQITCLRCDFSLPLGDCVGYNIVDINTITNDGKPFSEMMRKLLTL
jgi:hypothetical protein